LQADAAGMAEPAAAARLAILRERARLLARPPVRETSDEAPLEVVEFVLSGEHYGLESEYVTEVCPLRNLRPVPGAPAFVLGVDNVHGRIVSVIDLKRFFDLPQRGLTDLNRLIVVRYGAVDVGVLADQILAVRSIRPSELSPALPTLTGIRAEFVMGITRDPLTLLDAKRLLGNKRILINEE
jgi:purine-binding chemotaxis protein CheW